MKRTPLKRKTPLKAHTGLKRGRPLSKRRKAKDRPTIDKAALQHGERQRKRDEKYLAWIRCLPCAKCGVSGEGRVVPAHYRIGSKSGTGIKPSDYRTIPLCNPCHSRQHSIGEVTFWKGADPEIMIMKLNKLYGCPT